MMARVGKKVLFLLEFSLAGRSDAAGCGGGIAELMARMQFWRGTCDGRCRRRAPESPQSRKEAREDLKKF
jgi:hypothetical protein